MPFMNKEYADSIVLKKNQTFDEIIRGFSHQQLYMLSSASRSNGKSNWLAYSMAQSMGRGFRMHDDNFEEKVLYGLSRLDVGDIDGIISLYKDCTETFSLSVKLWEMLLFKEQKQINYDTRNQFRLQRETVEYFTIGDDKFKIEYSTTSFRLQRVRPVESTNSGAVQYNDIISLSKPTRGEKLFYDHDSSNRKFFASYRDDFTESRYTTLLETEIAEVPVLYSIEDVEAYIFQQSLLKENVADIMAPIIGSAIDNGLKFKYMFKNMSLTYEEMFNKPNHSLVEMIRIQSDRTVQYYKEFEDKVSKEIVCIAQEWGNDEIYKY